MSLTKNQEVLRTTAKFLRCVAEGAPTEPKDFKTFSDLCWLCVPIKYRMTKDEIADIESKPWLAAHHGQTVRHADDSLAGIYRAEISERGLIMSETARRNLAPTKADCEVLDAIMRAAKQIHAEFDCLGDHIKTKAEIEQQISAIIWKHVDKAWRKRAGE